LKKSGITDKDILEAARTIYNSDEKTPFKMEVQWQLLKDEPKWNFKSSESGTKRTKISASRAYSSSASGAYSSSSNLETETSEYNPTLPTMTRPMGRIATKKKGKRKLRGTSSNCKEEEEEAKMKEDVLLRIAATKESSARAKHEQIALEKEKHDMTILYKDTSGMDEEQLVFHRNYCAQIRKKCLLIFEM
jgi:hypothetical protein